MACFLQFSTVKKMVIQMYRSREIGPYNPVFFDVARYCQSLFHYSPRDIASIANKLLSKGDEHAKIHILYTDCLGELAGFIIFYYCPKVRIGFAECLAVTPNHRGRGIGKSLYLEMIALLQKHYPECQGHLFEFCQEDPGMEERKSFFLRQGCIPLNLNFFPLDSVICNSGIQILYHPYKADAQHNLANIEKMFHELMESLLH